MRTGAGAGDDICAGNGAGELCFVGEKEGRCAELGGKDECGELKLYAVGKPFAWRGEVAGECFTGDPARPADEAGRLKLCPYGGAYCGACCDELNGFARPNELPFCCGRGM